MVAKGRGGGKTPERVVRLLQEAVAKSSQAATSRASGLTLQTVQRYIKGIGEPSQATLVKLAAFFNVTVSYLRGESNAIRTREFIDNFDIPGRVEEIEQWIEEDEERRNWPDNQKAEIISGLTLVEKVLKDDYIAEYAVDYMKRRMNLFDKLEHEDEYETEEVLQAEIEKAEAIAVEEDWSENELEWIKALLRQHRNMIGSGLTIKISRKGLEFSSYFPTYQLPEDEPDH
jgi:transcriptional regulator with XRE-family HTH domain